ERVELTRTNNADVVVLGVDNEPYILINEKGVFENAKSATRLINQSTSKGYSKSSLKEFYETSDDPEQPPSWKKVSSSQSYRWHDHRAHYMGTIPSGAIDLGTSSLIV